MMPLSFIMNKERRLEAIFAAIRNGVPHTDILDWLERKDEDQRRGQLADERGFYSERNVKNAVRELPEVAYVKVISPRSPKNRAKIDLMVTLRDTAPVYIQVKSSNKHIRSAGAEIRKKYHISPEEYQEYLLERRLMFINGQLPRTEIKQQFLSKLEAIRAYHESKTRPVSGR